MIGLRAIMVSVEYHSELALCLPYNRHHFAEVMVVTTPMDEKTIAVARANDARVHTTMAFYARGAAFAKWAALEEALDAYGRHGVMAVMDSDICWPKDIGDFRVECGKLYTPLRRMCVDFSKGIPPESQWTRYALHSNVNEHAGYSHIMMADDPHLPNPPPWYDTSWSHCGGADSFLQLRWPRSHKVRPMWECLHLGSSGENWAGRVSRMADGVVPPQAAERAAKLRKFMLGRRGRPGYFEHEKLP